MKRVLVCSALLVAALCLSIAGFLHLRATKNYMEERFLQFSSVYTASGYEEALVLIDEAGARWHEHEHILCLYIDRQKLTEISSRLSLVRGLTEVDNTEAIAECNALKRQLDAIYATQLPLLKNIL